MSVETAKPIRPFNPLLEAIMIQRADVGSIPLNFRAVLPLLACSVLYSLLSGCESKQSRETSDSAAASHAEKSTDAAKPTSSSNVRAYIDPVTGALREPTKEDLAADAALEAAKNKSTPVGESKSTAQQEVVLPNGAVTIELGESAQQPLIACVGKDGNVKMDHDCPADPGAK